MTTSNIALAIVISLLSTGLAAQASMPVASAQTVRPLVKDGPHFKIDCAATPSKRELVIAARTATIWTPLGFHTTNSKFKLKFYKADIEFSGDPAPLPIGKARFSPQDMQLNALRFPKMAARVVDDDFPTVLEREGQLFEVKATSPLPRKMDGDQAFSINFKKSFSVLVESLPSNGSRKFAWAGTCKFNKPQADS